MGLRRGEDFIPKEEIAHWASKVAEHFEADVSIGGIVEKEKSSDYGFRSDCDIPKPKKANQTHMSPKFNDPYCSLAKMAIYVAVEPEIAARYGRRVRAVQLTNREYSHRHAKLSSGQKMMPAPSSGAIHLGYLTVRNLSLPNQYETWIPDSAFKEMYALEGASAAE